MAFWQKVVSKLKRLFQVSPLAIPTWLAIGAALQSFSLLLLPPRIGGLLPILYIVYRIAKTKTDSDGIFVRTYTNVKRGRWTSELPEPDDPESEKGVVMFLLAARFNHPKGLLAPAKADIGKAFADMWLEAGKNKQEYGFLGRAATLHDPADTEGVTLIWLSYWKSLEGLHAFATSPAHRIGDIDYQKNKYPYLGIMHETFYAPKGSWETMNYNMPPWGLAKISDALGTFRQTSSATKDRDASMFDRMRTNRAIAERKAKGSGEG